MGHLTPGWEHLATAGGVVLAAAFLWELRKMIRAHHLTAQAALRLAHAVTLQAGPGMRPAAQRRRGGAGRALAGAGVLAAGAFFIIVAGCAVAARWIR
jgi:hypothetical protein